MKIVRKDIDVWVKVIRQQAEVAQGVAPRLRHRILLTFGTTRVVGRQPFAPAAFTPEEIRGTHFQGLSRNEMWVQHYGKVTEKQLGSFIPLRKNKLKVQTQQIFRYKYPKTK
jgi:hypothetical protein